jgi:hypothetical protein
MVNTSRTGRGSPARVGWTTQSLTVFVDDVTAHLDGVRSAGCSMIEDLHETPYGELQYAVVDIENTRDFFLSTSATSIRRNGGRRSHGELGSNRTSDLNFREPVSADRIWTLRMQWFASYCDGPPLRSAESCSRSLVRRSARCPSPGLAPRIRTLLKCKTITGCGEIPVEPAINESIEILATAVVMVEVVRVLPQIDRQQACGAPVLRGICA